MHSLCLYLEILKKKKKDFIWPGTGIDRSYVSVAQHEKAVNLTWYIMELVKLCVKDHSFRLAHIIFQSVLMSLYEG